MNKTIKPTKCRVCPEYFTLFRRLQVVCSPLCASKLSRKKETEKRERENKIKYKDMRIRAKSTDYAKELQREINKLARQIDAKFGYKCIDCGGDYGKQTDGAHFHSVGGNNSVRYNLHNIHSAKSDCNNYSENHKSGYIEGLKSRYGEEYFKMVDGLPLKYPVIKLSHQEIYDKLKIVRRLNREFKKMPFKSAIKARNSLNKMIEIYTT